MKNHFIYSMALGAVLAVSCVNLDTVNPVSVGSNDMWTTERYVRAGLDGISNVFRPNPSVDEVTAFPDVHCIGRPRLEVISSTSYSVYCPSFFSRTYPSAFDNYFSLEWQYCYEGIHEANDALANMHKAGMTEDREEVYRCEALLWRTYFYQRLNMLFQGVPIYLEPVTNDECVKVRSTVDEVWEQCVKDLTYCIDNEYFPNNTLAASYGRPSKGAAYAMRGEIHVWRKEWVEAVADFEKVRECGYGFWDGEYGEMFTELYEQNPEVILPVQFSRTTGYGDWLQLWFGSRSTLNSHTRLHPSKFLVDSFENKDGSPFRWTDIFPDWDALEVDQREVFFARDSLNTNTKSTWTGAKANIVNRVGQDVWDKYYLDNGNQDRLYTAFKDRDPRLEQILFVPTRTYKTCSGTGLRSSLKTVLWPNIYAGNGETDGDYQSVDLSLFYYCYRKFVVVDDKSMDRDCSGYDWPLVRYTHIALLQAEALNELGRSQEALDILNVIRGRAHMPELVLGGAAPTGVSGQDEVLERIRHESRIEMCGEGVNYLDEVRWGTYKESKFGGLDHTYSENAWGSANYNMYWKDEIWPWPVPGSEVQKNPLLEKTPGWEY